MDFIDEEHGWLTRVRADAERAREDAGVARERPGYALHQVAELRKRVPSTVQQAAAPGTLRR